MVDIQGSTNLIHFSGDGRINLFLHTSSKITSGAISSVGNSFVSVGTLVWGIYSPSCSYKNFKNAWDNRTPGSSLYFTLTGPEFNNYDERLYFLEVGATDLKFNSSLSTKEAIEQYSGTTLLFGHNYFDPVAEVIYYMSNFLALPPAMISESEPPSLISPMTGSIRNLYVSFHANTLSYPSITIQYTIKNITAGTSKTASASFPFGEYYQTANVELPSSLLVTKGDKLNIEFIVNWDEAGVDPSNISQSINVFIGI